MTMMIMMIMMTHWMMNQVTHTHTHTGMTAMHQNPLKRENTPGGPDSDDPRISVRLLTELEGHYTTGKEIVDLVLEDWV